MAYDREEACRAWLTYGYFRTGDLDDIMTAHDGCAEAVYEEALLTRGKSLQDALSPENLAALMAAAEKSAMHDMLIHMQKH